MLDVNTAATDPRVSGPWHALQELMKRRGLQNRFQKVGVDEVALADCLMNGLGLPACVLGWGVHSAVRLTWNSRADELEVYLVYEITDWLLVRVFFDGVKGVWRLDKHASLDEHLPATMSAADLYDFIEHYRGRALNEQDALLACDFLVRDFLDRRQRQAA